MSKPTLGKPLHFWKGNPFTQGYRFKDGAGVGLDLSGRPLRAFILFPGTPPIAVTAEPGSGWTLADQAPAETKGRATLAFDKATILDWPVGKGRYEIELDDVTLIYGDAIVNQWTANND